MVTPRVTQDGRRWRLLPVAMLLAAPLFCGASLLAPAPDPRAEGLGGPMPVLRETQVEMVFPGQPELGILTVTMFLP